MQTCQAVTDELFYILSFSPERIGKQRKYILRLYIFAVLETVLAQYL